MAGVVVVGGVAILVLAGGFATLPLATAGFALGGLLFFSAVRWPLAVVCILLAIGPVDLSPLTGGRDALVPQLGGLDMNGIRLVSVAAGLGLVALLDPRLRGLVVSPYARWYVALLAFGALSIPFSMDPMEGARLWTKIAWPLLIFLVIAHPDRTGRDVERAGNWILIGAAATILINPAYVMAGGYEFDFDGRLRIQGVGRHQNPFAFYLGIMSLFALTRLVYRRQLRYAILAGGTLAWMALTLTRISFLAGLMALLAAGIYAGFVHRRPGVVAAVAGGTALLGMILVPVALARTFGYIPSPGELWALSRSPVLLYETMDLAGRELYWGLLYAAWAESPLLGLGLGSSTAVITSVLPEEFGTVAHNEYLRLGTDLGWLGMALAALAAVGWVRSVRGGDPRGEWTFPVFGALIMWAVISITDNGLDYYAAFSQFVGFAVGAAVVMNRERAEPEAGPREEA